MAQLNFVLVTGATGFIGAHITAHLLSRGFKVRATCRSPEKGKRLQSSLAQYTSQLKIAVTGDITQPGVFDEAVKGVDGIVHSASVRLLPFTSSDSSPEADEQQSPSTGLSPTTKPKSFSPPSAAQNPSLVRPPPPHQ
jgi:nucleoside-diphosphate-sugar epimerase